MNKTLVLMTMAIVLGEMASARSVTETTEPSTTSDNLLNPVDIQSLTPAVDRTKRQYGSHHNYDFYNKYYNDYYANYYASQYYPNRKNEINQLYNSQSGSYNPYDYYYNQAAFVPAPAPPPIRPTAERFDGNNGVQYVYTPLFQYKETHQKHQKLFVPNLFG